MARKRKYQPSPSTVALLAACCVDTLAKHPEVAEQVRQYLNFRHTILEPAMRKNAESVWPPEASDDPARFDGLDLTESEARMRELQAQLGQQAGLALEGSASTEDREFAALSADLLSDQIDALRERIQALQGGLKLANHDQLLALATVYQRRGDLDSYVTCVAVWLSIREGRQDVLVRALDEDGRLRLPFVHPRELAEAVREQASRKPDLRLAR